MDYSKKYLAFVLDEASREKLKKQFPPNQPKVFYHHVTIKFNGITDKDVEIWSPLKKAYVVGFTSDSYLEAVIVDLASNTTREDGGTYHVTLSLDPDHRKPVDSNRLIQSKKWIPIKTPILITGEVKLEPK